MMYDTSQDIGHGMELTAVFRKVPEGYIAFVEEVPGANTQAPTLDEARRNLKKRSLWSSKAIGNWLRNR
jgi:hypothetical protein